MKNAPSLKLNTISNFIGLGYTTLVGIVVFPLYLQFLGAEAFGLVGFFMLLQAWMQLLDMGMSPLLSRQAACARGQVGGLLKLMKILRSLEIIVFIIALIIAVSIILASDWIANYWLNITTLVISEVIFCIVLMGVMIGLRFFASLYRSGIRGMENQVQLNIINMIFVTLKFVGAFFLLAFVSKNFVYFFVYQLFVGIIELLVLAAMFYRLIPTVDKVGIGFYWEVLKPVLPFTVGIAYTTGIGVIVTQLDKLVLSSVLPLSEYGYFALVAVVATGIAQLSGPISQAILPRMTHLLSIGHEKNMLSLYRASTQLMGVVIFPIAGMVAFFSTELIFSWTGDKSAAEWGGPVLFWFSLGSGVVAINAFQYYLQFAHGKLKMHVLFNSFSAITQAPIIAFIAYEYGAEAVAFSWFVIKVVIFIIWPPIVHHNFAPGIHVDWLFKDVLPQLLCTIGAMLLLGSIPIIFSDLDRISTLLVLMAFGFFTLGANIFVSSSARSIVIKCFSRPVVC